MLLLVARVGAITSTLVITVLINSDFYADDLSADASRHLDLVSWEKEFKEINPMIKSSGIRKYTKENIESIRLIYTLLKKDGLTIQGAKKKLKSKDISEDENLAILKKLNKIKEELKSLKKTL